MQPALVKQESEGNGVMEYWKFGILEKQNAEQPTIQHSPIPTFHSELFLFALSCGRKFPSWAADF